LVGKGYYNLEHQTLTMATEQSQKLVTITAKAAEKIKEFMAEETDKPEFLRIYVQGGGCSGLSYGMGFEKVKMMI